MKDPPEHYESSGTGCQTLHARNPQETTTCGFGYSTKAEYPQFSKGLLPHRGEAGFPSNTAAEMTHHNREACTRPSSPQRCVSRMSKGFANKQNNPTVLANVFVSENTTGFH